MSLVLECIWKCSFAILVLYTLFVKAEDTASDDTDLDKRNYNHMFVGKRFNHMFVGKRFNHMFVGKRFNHMFVGKRFNHMFVGKRFNHMFVGKRFNHMFVGKRWPEDSQMDTQVDSDNKLGDVLLGKRLLPNQWNRYFVWKRPLAYRMFVGKRDNDANLHGDVTGEYEEQYGDPNAEEYYNEAVHSVNPFVAMAMESSKEKQSNSQ